MHLDVAQFCRSSSSGWTRRKKKKTQWGALLTLLLSIPAVAAFPTPTGAWTTSAHTPRSSSVSKFKSSVSTSESSASSAASTTAAAVGKLAFSLAQTEDEQKNHRRLSGSLGDLFHALSRSSLLEKFVKYIGELFTGQTATPDKPSNKTFSPSLPVMLDLPQEEHVRRAFEQSLSHDEAVVSVQAGDKAPPHKIADEAFTNVLFGDRGILTEVFKMLDAKKTNEQSSSTQNDAQSAKIKQFDFIKIFETMLSGGSENQLGDPAPELPEFLGICNRLSCGDIYKAIDQFRKSEFFSNFQTALSLIQDPKGWEILGKLLSNPELLAQFTGDGAGEGVESGTGGIAQVLGSAIGAKKEVAKGSQLTKEDGDFGTDFSPLVVEKEEKPDGAVLPEASFSVDEKATGGGAGEDYYAEIVHNIDEDFDTLDNIDEVDSTTVKPDFRISAAIPESLPPIAFSEDENDEMQEESEVVIVDQAIDSLPEFSDKSDGSTSSTNYSTPLGGGMSPTTTGFVATIPDAKASYLQSIGLLPARTGHQLSSVPSLSTGEVIHKTSEVLSISPQLHRASTFTTSATSKRGLSSSFPTTRSSTLPSLTTRSLTTRSLTPSSHTNPSSTTQFLITPSLITRSPITRSPTTRPHTTRSPTTRSPTTRSPTTMSPNNRSATFPLQSFSAVPHSTKSLVLRRIAISPVALSTKSTAATTSNLSTSKQLYRTITTTGRTPTKSTRNYRKDDDYYAMYYD